MRGRYEGRRRGEMEIDDILLWSIFSIIEVILDDGVMGKGAM